MKNKKDFRTSQVIQLSKNCVTVHVSPLNMIVLAKKLICLMIEHGHCGGPSKNEKNRWGILALRSK